MSEVCALEFKVNIRPNLVGLIRQCIIYASTNNFGSMNINVISEIEIYIYITRKGTA